MIDSIATAESGLKGYESALQTISNNTANMNTPGFKGSTMEFADLAAAAGGGEHGLAGEAGQGLRTLGTVIDFSQGQMQSSNDPLDVAINGQGFFVTRDTAGNLHYTRDGQFKFDNSGNLVSKTSGEQVMGFNGGTTLAPITLNGVQSSAPKATAKVTFSGNLSSGATSDNVSSVTVIDTTGASHSLSVTLTPVTGSTGSWTVKLLDGTTTVGTSTLTFSASGSPTSATASLPFTYTPTGGTAMPVTLDFSTNVTSFNSGSSSTLVVGTQDGFALGTLTGETFDTTGTLVLAYSNNQTSKTQQLALAQFQSPDEAEAVGNSTFRSKDGRAWATGVASTGVFGSIQGSEIEGSNVDLSREFSNLVIMQRGYQASSQVVSTAGDMLTAMFGMMKG